MTELLTPPLSPGHQGLEPTKTYTEELRNAQAALQSYQFLLSKNPNNQEYQ